MIYSLDCKIPVCFSAFLPPILLSLTFFILQMPKLLQQEVLQSSKTLCSAVACGELFYKYFNVFSTENVYLSIFRQENSSNGLYVRSGTFGFSRLMDLSPAEVTFLGTGSFIERLLFSISRWDNRFLNGTLDSLMEVLDDDFNSSYLEKGTVKAVTRMLLMPSRSDINSLRRLATGPGHDPFEALVVSHQDRLLSNTKLLHSTYTFIPRTRAPVVCSHFLCHLFSSMGYSLN